VNIRGSHTSISSDLLATILQETAVSYSRPLDPLDSNYALKLEAMQSSLLHAVQIHKCGQGCLKVNNGRFLCKWQAPFTLAKSAWVDSEGNWGPKRDYAMLNNWNPALLLATHSNHNVKVVINGADMNNIGCYLTQYMANKQQRSFNVLALLVKTLAFH